MSDVAGYEAEWYEENAVGWQQAGSRLAKSLLARLYRRAKQRYQPCKLGRYFQYTLRLAQRLRGRRMEVGD
jgi:hypothetical protein